MLTNTPTPQEVSRVHQNAAILANIVELTCACVKKAAEADVANALGDDSLNKSVLGSIVANHIQATLIQA